MDTTTWIQRSFRLVREQGGDEVCELISSHSDTVISGQETARKIAQLERQTAEWRLRYEVAAQELRKTEARCSLLERESRINSAPASVIKPAFIPVGRRAKSEIFTEADRLKEAVNLCHSLRKELEYRDRILGLTSFREEGLGLRYNRAVTELVEKKSKVEKQLELVREENDELKEVIKVKDQVLRYSRSSWKAIYMELGQLFSNLNTGAGARNRTKRVRRNTFGESNDIIDIENEVTFTEDDAVYAPKIDRCNAEAGDRLVKTDYLDESSDDNCF